MPKGFSWVSATVMLDIMGEERVNGSSEFCLVFKRIVVPHLLIKICVWHLLNVISVQQKRARKEHTETQTFS